MPRVKKEITKKSIIKPVAKKLAGLSVPVYSLAGKEMGSCVLPKELFGAEVNKKLLAQAVRVYMTNQKNLTASTKTRGEVRGSTRKVYKQKGTGGARHGAIRAPIYVGGGIVFGPRPRKVRLALPRSMKKAALASALSAKMVDQGVLGLEGIGKATGKTKEIVKLLGKLNIKSTLIVTAGKTDNIIRAVRNIMGVDVLPANQINAYEVLRHNKLIITKETIDKIAGIKIPK